MKKMSWFLKFENEHWENSSKLQQVSSKTTLLFQIGGWTAENGAGNDGECDVGLSLRYSAEGELFFYNVSGVALPKERV